MQLHLPFNEANLPIRMRLTTAIESATLHHNNYPECRKAPNPLVSRPLDLAIIGSTFNNWDGVSIFGRWSGWKAVLTGMFGNLALGANDELERQDYGRSV